MSKVSYYVGSEAYSFDSCLQLKNIPLIAVEENLHNEVRLDFQKKKLPHYGIHDITICDDNGIIACAENFEKIGNLKIVKL